jgi:hypothetical protein
MTLYVNFEAFGLQAALPSSVVFGAANALQPWHIREAHRRYSHFIGPMSAYSVSPAVHMT